MTLSSTSRSDGFSLTKILALGVVAVLTLFTLVSLGRIAENVSADEIVVIQAPFTGKLTWYTSPGVKGQWFGKVTSYPRRATYEFETQVRFNDGGHGIMKGSVQYEMPLDAVNLTALHTRFGSRESIQTQLIEKVTNKSVYMTGPLMSSKESYAEKRNYLINYVEDQISNGVYRTIQHEAKILDQLTGQEKTAIVVDTQMTNGVPQRQESAILSEFGLKTFNFAINALTYDETVEKQIQAQQQITMDVQTAIAEARKAEQRKITTEQQGMANAAQAKWAQEVIKATEVTAAQQRVEVASLGNKEADQYREATLKRADADATYRKRVMEADGALEQRLRAQVEIAKANATAIQNIKVPIVPTTVFGGQNGGNSAATLMDMLTIQAAKQVGLSKD